MQYNRCMIGLLIGANMIMAIGFAIRWNRLPSQIPLFYSLPGGEDQLVEWWMIFLLPILMNALVILNRTIMGKISVQNTFIRSLLTYANYAIMLVCGYVFLRIIFLVT